MKSVLMTLDDANKLGISGAEKLAKTDELIMLYVKGKKNPKAELAEALEGLKCNIIYEEMATASELNLFCAFYAGYNKAKNRDTFIVSSDKEKLNNLVKSNCKIYVVPSLFRFTEIDSRIAFDSATPSPSRSTRLVKATDTLPL